MAKKEISSADVKLLAEAIAVAFERSFMASGHGITESPSIADVWDKIGHSLCREDGRIDMHAVVIREGCFKIAESLGIVATSIDNLADAVRESK